MTGLGEDPEVIGDEPPLPELLVAAIAGLAKLVRNEYPADASMGEIAATWGEDLTPDEVGAVRLLDLGIVKFLLRWRYHPVPQVVNEQTAEVVDTGLGEGLS